MSERTLVPIFFFWAFLTIITPTLILLSENSKDDFDINGNITEGMKARRMMSDPEKYVIRFRTKAQTTAEEMAPSPAPNPSMASYSYHDQRNGTYGGLKLLSPKTQVEQTGITSAST
ncbi:uncharacterized protein LOC129317568 [Prosopis cineraria]|uniref:uncharacterized protein LOC129317568 n=1 Tax=Prosopis cineraria TaxID=364024 RepID=UPI0024100BB7|nr:uncharacterized protein LOC129317568 [Prosopis cineraria]